MDYIAEQSVLGAMLQAPEIVPEALSTVKAEDFLLERDRRLYEAARALFREGAPVDALTVLGKLRRDRDKDWRDYVAAVMECTPTAANWREYAGIMHNTAVMARLKEYAAVIAEAQTLDDCRKPMAEMTSLFNAGRGIKSRTLEELLTEFSQRQSLDHDQKERYLTGFSPIDHLAKLTGGKFVIIAGQPSDGKTALALQWALNMAAKTSVGIFSLETDDETVTDRLVTHGFGIDYDHITDQRLTDLDWIKFAEKLPLYAQRNLRVCDEGRLSADQIIAVSTIYGHKVIFVDYGQLIQTDSERGVPRAEKLARVSQYLKIAARETDTLVVLLLQLKQPERYKTNDGRVRTLSPTMEDLGESRQWMKDADVIFILSRPDGSENSSDEDGEKLSYNRHRYLKVAKNKEGKRGTMTLTFDGLHQSFYPKGQEPDARKPSDRKKQPAGHPGQITFSEQQETGDEPF